MNSKFDNSIRVLEIDQLRDLFRDWHPLTIALIRKLSEKPYDTRVKFVSSMNQVKDQLGSEDQEDRDLLELLNVLALPDDLLAKVILATK